MKNLIYCIGRQYGSGGREIGEKLAKELNIPFYDKELLVRVAHDSGVDASIIEKADEKVDYSFYYLNAMGFAVGSGLSGVQDISLNDKIFLEQSKVIEDIASKGSCVIVGRCADYILANNPDAVSIFIHATLEDRVVRVEEEYDIESNDIENYIIKTDKRRANYYNYYTDRKWGRTDSYELVLSSSKFGIDGCIDIIKSISK